MCRPHPPERSLRGSRRVLPQNVTVSLMTVSLTGCECAGEIVPQSVCTRYGLAVGYYARHLMRIAMALTSPIAWPLGKLLDALLGHGAAIFRRNQLKAFAHVHGADAGFGGELTQEEVQFIHGTLDMHKKIAAHAMTPLEKVHMLSTDALLDEACMQRIMDTGVSRMPVYQADNKSDIVGLIMVKELLLKLAVRIPACPSASRLPVFLPPPSPCSCLRPSFCAIVCVLVAWS